MKPIRLVFALFLSLIVIASCNSATKDKPAENKEERGLPAVKPLSAFPQTMFAATLESPVTAGKNVVYAPTLLYAWDTIRGMLHSPVVAGEQNNEAFRLLNSSVSFKNTLHPDEYEINTEANAGSIIARAFFHKDLPFETPMQPGRGRFVFNGNDVMGFGMYDYDEKLVKQARILYYEDDDHFVLKLLPRDTTQEIILVKGLDKDLKTLSEGLKSAEEWISRGQKESAQPGQAWKYALVDKDEISVPQFRFNLETNYRDLESQDFTTEDFQHWSIRTAYQRTAFLFDEKGAIVESEAVIAVDSAISAVPSEHPSKYLVLDKPFWIVLRRSGSANPYFVLRVENAELMKPYEFPGDQKTD